MIKIPSFADHIRNVFQPTSRGIIGLVDDLLGLCRTYQLRITFQDGHCHACPLGADSQEGLELPVAKTVFRAILARVAAICNEFHPGSVTPYRGEGEIVVPAPQSENSLSHSICHVDFTNTPSEQKLEVRFFKSSFANGIRFTVLLRDNRTVTVFGHTIKYVSGESIYKILARIRGKRVVVAVFPHTEVRGVFNGDINPLDRTTKKDPLTPTGS